VSLGTYPPAEGDLERGAQAVAWLVQQAPWREWGTALINVNLPNNVRPPYRLRATQLARTRPPVEFIRHTDPRGRPYHWIGGVPAHFPGEPGSDRAAIADGFISMSALRLWDDDAAALERVRSFCDHTPA
jgi:broad specificity polyphosphatase/5'/3'-nucleotidase SurE